MVLKEKIDKIVQDGDWEFAKLLKLNDVCSELSEEMYSKLSPSEILELIWEIQYEEKQTLGMIITNHARLQLKHEFINSFQKCFESATVQFKSPVKDESPKDSINIEQPPLPKSKKEEKPKKEKEMIKGEDGMDIPKGVKRV
jgi:hypothetical protein